MDIEKLAIRKVSIDDDCDYHALYSDSRGAIFKEDYKHLIREAISRNAITIEKFVIAENVGDELDQIIDTKGVEKILVNRLKNHHREPDYVSASIIYLLKKLDPDFTCSTKGEKLGIVSDQFEVEVRPRIDEADAEPRLFFAKEEIAITSTNDDIETLGDVLAVKDIKVYAVGTDDNCNNIYVYKINRTDDYFKVADGFKDEVRAKAGEQFFRYFR